MNTKPDGVNWAALRVIVVVGIAAAGAIWVLDQRTQSRIESLEQRIETRLNEQDAEIAAVKTDIAVMTALLERIERRLPATIGGQVNAAGFMPAKPLPVSDCTADPDLSA